jgi:YidC/Oxa1 family membrane protein insertase
MDKRTVIGIVLIIAIFLLMPLYQKMFTGNKVQENKQIETHSTATKADSLKIISADTTKLTEVKSDTTQATKPVFPQAEVKKIKIETSKYSAVITTAGGDIESFRLKGIFNGGGKEVELAPTYNDDPKLEFAIKSNSFIISSADIVFQSDADSLVLNDIAKTGAVTLVGVSDDGTMFQRRYEFDDGYYMIRHKVFVVLGDSTKTIDDATLRWKSGLQPTEVNYSDELNSYSASYRLGDEYDKVKPSKKEPLHSQDGATDWVGVSSKYFSVVLMPEKELSADGYNISTSFEKIEGLTKDVPRMQIALINRVKESKFAGNYMIYFGPRDYFIIKNYSRMLTKNVDLGWWWLAPITQGLLWIFKWIFKILPNYGLVIILFTIIMKLALMPASNSQMKSMSKMKDLQPQLKSLQERYRDDPKMLNTEMMKMYKKQGVSPLSGCLPMLAQMPIFFALYRALSDGFQFRAQPFLFYIKDLSQKDPYFILPVLMTVTMFIQQKISITDPKQKMMVYIMPVVFLFLFYKMPAGLVLYWTVFNILSVAHMLWIEKNKTTDAIVYEEKKK